MPDGLQLIDSEDRPTVLIVDDETDVRGAYAALLNDFGFDVVEAATGAEALDAISGLPRPSAIVSDINMPALNGLQLLRAVRERDLDLPVILVTGNPALDSAMEAMELGALQYMVKPVSSEVLRSAVARAVRLGRLARVKREALASLHSGRLIGDLAGLQARFPGALQALRMAYQPIVRSSDGSLYAREALMRCSDPLFLQPSSLIEAAERLGKVHELGRAVRQRVAREVDAGGSPIVFVNVHPQELADESLFAPGSPLAGNSGRVVLEITERVCLDVVPDVVARIKRLRKLGFRIALDDMGAGYAGLTSFAVLEPEIVKLDMALVQGAERGDVQRRVIRSMVELCRDLGILVIAEGVETVEQRDVMIECGCDLLQGFLFGRPIVEGP